MYILELILALQVNDFAIPQRDKVNDAVSKAYECQQTTGYSDQCADVIDKLIHKKEQLGGIYVNYQ